MFIITHLRILLGETDQIIQNFYINFSFQNLYQPKYVTEIFLLLTHTVCSSKGQGLALRQVYEIYEHIHNLKLIQSVTLTGVQPYHRG